MIITKFLQDSKTLESYGNKFISSFCTVVPFETSDMVHSYSHGLILSFPPCSWPTGIAPRLNNGSRLKKNLSEQHITVCTYMYILCIDGWTTKGNCLPF